MAPKIRFLVLGLGAAGIAGVLAGIAHTEFGLSPSVIRRAALICSGLLVLGLYSDRFGDLK